MLLKWFIATLILYVPITLGVTFFIRGDIKQIFRKPDGSDGICPEERDGRKKLLRGFYILAFLCFLFQWLFMYFTDGGRTLREALM